MSKNYFCQRWSDGQLMQFSGTSWATFGSYTPSNWPSSHRQRACCGVFVLDGKLHTRYKNNTTVYVDVLGSTDVGALVNCTAANTTANSDSNDNEVWSNAFQYKGKVFWFATVCDGNSNNWEYVYIYTFYYDSSNVAHLSMRRCDEMGQFFNGRDFSSNLLSNTSSQNAMIFRVMPFRDRLLAVPAGAAAGSDGGNRLFGHTIARIDIDAATSQVTFGPVHDAYPQARMYRLAPNDRNDMLSFVTVAKNTCLTATDYKGDICFLNYLGQIYKYTYSSGTSSLVADLQTLTSMQVNAGATYTTDIAATNTNLTLQFSTPPTNDYYWPYCQGGFITIQNYNGVNGSTKTGYISEMNDRSDIMVIDTTGAVVGNQPIGTKFNVAFGFASGLWTTDPQSMLRWAHMLTYNGKMYTLTGNGATFVWQTTEAADIHRQAPWSLSEYDGTTINHTFFTNGSTPFYCEGFSFELDDTNGVLSMFYFDVAAGAVKHVQFDLVNKTMTNVGSVYSRNSDSYLAAMSHDSFVAFNVGDVTATIDSVSSSTSAGTITLNYHLFGSRADTASISVQYNNGGIWSEATQKSGQGDAKTGLVSSAAGTSHTFVHDVVTDLTVSFAGSLEYRIIISSQTRN